MCVFCDQTKGELSGERKEKCETMQNNFHKLLQTTQTLAVSFLLVKIRSTDFEEQSANIVCKSLHVTSVGNRIGPGTSASQWHRYALVIPHW